jgi:hypothetical protein
MYDLAFLFQPLSNAVTRQCVRLSLTRNRVPLWPRREKPQTFD